MLYRHVYKKISKECEMVVRKFKIESVTKALKIRILNHLLILLIRNLVEKTLRL